MPAPSLRRSGSTASPGQRRFQITFGLITLFFAVDGLTYVVEPELAVRVFSGLNELLGGDHLAPPDVPPWRYGTTAGITTLAVMCALLQLDVRRFYALLGPVVFFKACNAVLYLGGYATTPLPVYLALAGLDVILCVAMVATARRARADLAAQEAHRSASVLVPASVVIGGDR